MNRDMKIVVIMLAALFTLSITIAIANAHALSVAHHQETGYPMKQFIVTSENDETQFSLQNKSGIVFQITVDYLYRELAWLDGNDVFMVVNISAPGAAVFLTKCNDYPLSLKPNVMYKEYKLSRVCLNAEDGCLNLHIIATEGAVDGQIIMTTKEPTQWFHLHIMIAVISSIVIFILLLRACVNSILRVVFSYTMMDDTEATLESLQSECTADGLPRV